MQTLIFGIPKVVFPFPLYLSFLRSGTGSIIRRSDPR